MSIFITICRRKVVVQKTRIQWIFRDFSAWKSLFIQILRVRECGACKFQLLLVGLLLSRKKSASRIRHTSKQPGRNGQIVAFANSSAKKCKFLTLALPCEMTNKVSFTCCLPNMTQESETLFSLKV